MPGAVCCERGGYLRLCLEAKRFSCVEGSARARGTGGPGRARGGQGAQRGPGLEGRRVGWVQGP